MYVQYMILLMKRCDILWQDDGRLPDSEQIPCPNSLHNMHNSSLDLSALHSLGAGSPGEIEVRNWWYILQVNTVGSSARAKYNPAHSELSSVALNRDISIPKFGVFKRFQYQILGGCSDPRCLATDWTCKLHGFVRSRHLLGSWLHISPDAAARRHSKHSHKPLVVLGSFFASASCICMWNATVTTLTRAVLPCHLMSIFCQFWCQF